MTNATNTPATIRYLIGCDLPNVVAIESACFTGDAWNEDEFLAILGRDDMFGHVIEVDGQVAGFMVFQTQRHSAILMTLAVAPEWQRRGLGRQLVGRLVAKVNGWHPKRNSIVAKVREENLPAQLLLSGLGFRATLTLRNSYDWCDSDAYVMTYRVK